jgi:hypothetical protein
MPLLTQDAKRLDELRTKAVAAKLTLEEQNEFAMLVSLMQDELEEIEKELEIMREWLRK